VLVGALEQERAPATCELFRTLLPLRAKLLQARWSGQAAWVPLTDLDLMLGPENQMHRPAPGQVLFYSGGLSPTEILVPYGETAFAAKCGALSGNHFLTLDVRPELLQEIGHRVWWGGALDILFELIAADATSDQRTISR
jgi:hypothetical protein